MPDNSDERRRALCEEVGVDWDAVQSSGRSMALLDRLLSLRMAMPRDVAENLTLIERQWNQPQEGVQ